MAGAAAGYVGPMLILSLLLACSDGAVDITVTDGGAGADGGGAQDDGGTGDGGSLEPPPCPVGAEHEQTGTLQDPDISETSGLVVSATDPDLLWLHNDSGDSARLFAVNQQGQTMATVTLAGVEADDWEDLALGPGPDPGAPWLFVGDIGDNGRTDGTARIWMLPEPPFQDGTVSAELLELDYPDGPHDAEALFVDPVQGHLVIVTKEKGGVALVFAADLAADEPALEQVATVDLDGIATGMLTLVTAADLTPDGGCVLLRTYTHLLGYPRPEGQPAWAAFDSTPELLATEVELQGETVAAYPGGYWTVSEGEGAALNHFSLPPPP